MSIAMQFLRRLSLIKDLLNISGGGTIHQTGAVDYLHSTPANYEKPLSVPCHEGVQKAVFDHMFDYRQAWNTWRQRR